MDKKLPIGQQDFRKIREFDALYIDKTEYLYNIVSKSGGYFFLARPRRFGKSLTLSTIKELFEGNREIFKGLWIEPHWDWNSSHPVIHISFNEVDYTYNSLHDAIKDELKKQAARFDIQLTGNSAPRLFKELLEKLAASKGPVVILIDEYDKPLIDFLDKDKIPQALENQSVLKSFYAVIKSSDALIRFLLITGVSKFSKVGVFSDLNNLLDISIHPMSSRLTGITEEELTAYFGEEIEARATALNQPNLREQIRTWYNGYSFYEGDDKVYNPFSLLSFFSGWSFKNFWFSTGTPTFLINILREREFFDFDMIEAGVSAFESYNIEKLETVPLLFQTGYLTIKHYDPELLLYTLGYPNKEVKDSMLQHLIGAFRHGEVYESTPAVVKMYKAFKANDLEAVMLLINDMFQSIPYQLFIHSKENLYHALIHLLFTYLGQYMQSEVNLLRGRLDALVQTESHVYIFEFKLDKSAKAALQQIIKRDYTAPYRNTGKKVVAVGVNFSSEDKRIAGWEMA
jgi:hypothetical protein